MGVAVGGLLSFTNARELLSDTDVVGLRWAAYAMIALACAFAALRPRLARRGPDRTPSAADLPAT